MPNIKDLKKKIRGTQSTLKITNAMKLVSGSLFLKAQSEVLQARAYANELENTTKIITALIENYQHRFIKSKKSKFAFLLVISSNRGLCGGYNIQLANYLENFLKESELDFKLFFIGKKVGEILPKKYNIGDTFTFKKSIPTFKEIKDLGDQLGQYLLNGEIGQIFVAYNYLKSASSYIPIIKRILPISFEKTDKIKLRKEFPFDFIYEPGPHEILDELIPRVYIYSLYMCFLNAQAAEHGARMTTMDNASKNCREIIDKQRVIMNKLRQTAITKELIEIVSGAESLEV